MFSWQVKDPMRFVQFFRPRSYFSGLLKVTAPKVQPVGDVQIWLQFPLWRPC